MMNTEIQTIEPFLLTPKEAAKALAVCERTLYGLDKSGELPAVRIGRAVRYDVNDLRAWINQQKNVEKRI